MTTPQKFDLVVIGTGTAGSMVAKKCRAAGWSVAIVDSRPYGGTCALRGCDPKKVLVGAAEAVDAVKRLAGKGVRSDALRIEWAELARFKRTFTDDVPDRTSKGLADAGIETFRGRARFVAKSAVQVGDDVLEAGHVHVATGALPMKLGVPGEEHLTTSDHFLELTDLPPRLLFIGSGFISFEFAHIAATAGAHVTMLEMTDRPLAGFDRDLVGLLVERTRKMGVDIELNTKVEAIERVDGALVVRTAGAGGARTFTAERVVHGAGRVPELDDLDLDAAGVTREKRGIVVNEFLQSVSNPSVYAAGDAAASGPMLTPVAAYEAHVVVANLLRGNVQMAEYPEVPSVVFTLPPLASVGLQEREAKERGIRLKKTFQRTGEWYSSRRVGEEFSAHKILIDEDADRVVGAHLIGPRSDELINVFALAIRAGVPTRELKKTLFAYPTLASDIGYML